METHLSFWRESFCCPNLTLRVEVAVDEEKTEKRTKKKNRMASNPKDAAPPKKEEEPQPTVPDFPHLAHKNAVLNLKCIMEKAREDLTKCLAKVKGQKILVLDEQLLAPVGQIADKQFFEVLLFSHFSLEFHSLNQFFFLYSPNKLKKCTVFQIKHLKRTLQTWFTSVDPKSLSLRTLPPKLNISSPQRRHSRAAEHNNSTFFLFQESL